MQCSINNNSFIIPPAPLRQRNVAEGPWEEQMLSTAQWLPSPECDPAAWLSASGGEGDRDSAQFQVSLKASKQKTQATNLKISKREFAHWNSDRLSSW
jgi:hypothetical protein